MLALAQEEVRELQAELSKCQASTKALQETSQALSTASGVTQQKNAELKVSRAISRLWGSCTIVLCGVSRTAAGAIDTGCGGNKRSRSTHCRPHVRTEPQQPRTFGDQKAGMNTGNSTTHVVFIDWANIRVFYQRRTQLHIVV